MKTHAIRLRQSGSLEAFARSMARRSTLLPARFRSITMGEASRMSTPDDCTFIIDPPAGIGGAGSSIELFLVHLMNGEGSTWWLESGHGFRWR
jgi:hypothetical protein